MFKTEDLLQSPHNKWTDAHPNQKGTHKKQILAHLWTQSSDANN